MAKNRRIEAKSQRIGGKIEGKRRENVIKWDIISKMLFFAITGLINALSSTFVGLLVYLKNRKETLNKVFGLMCLSIAVWGFSYFVWQMSTTKESALFWVRGAMMGAIFIPVTYLHFVLVFLELHRSKKLFLILSYTLPFILALLNFTPLIVKNVAPELFFPYWPKPGMFFHLFILMFHGYVIYGCYLLLKSFWKTRGLVHAQIRYILATSIIGFLSGTTNHFLWYGIPVPPYWNILVALFPIIITYAILKYYLFEIRVILTELLVGAFSILLFVQIFLSDSVLEYIWNTIVFIIFLIFGYLFIKGVLKEIKLKQQLGEAAWGVLEQGQKISDDLRKAMADRERILKEWFLSDINKELEMNTLRQRIKELEEKLKEKKEKYDK